MMKVRDKVMVAAMLLLTLASMVRVNIYVTEENTAKLDNRFMSINLGGGKCLWEKALPLGKDAVPFGTLLASYPASGMRLTWQHTEALTGIAVGDDYGFVKPESDERTGIMKTQYPHLEGIWSWGDKLDQVILVIRNPRWAIPAYHSILFEIAYAQDYEAALPHYMKVFTTRPPLENWVKWRDYMFHEEISVWGWIIDYWMKGGEQYWEDHDFERNGQYPFHWVPEDERKQDSHCITDLECTPKDVISYERIRDPLRGPPEANKIAKLLENKLGMNVIEEEARGCVWNRTMEYNPLMSPNEKERTQLPKEMREENSFTYSQLLEIRAKIFELKERYGAVEWASNHVATDLVLYFTDYIDELDQEIIEMEANPPPTPAPNAAYAAEIQAWYNEIKKGNRYPKEKVENMAGVWPHVKDRYDGNSQP